MIPVMGKNWEGPIAAVVLSVCGLAGVGLVSLAQSRDMATMKAEYKRPPARPVKDQAIIDLGRQLFWDTRVSGSGKTACVTCHLPYLGYGATEKNSRMDSGRIASRKSQPLLGMRHVPIYGWDGRNPSLEMHAKNAMLTGAMSMTGPNVAQPVKVEVVEGRIRNIPEYAAQFAALEAPVNVDMIAKAIAVYERSLEPGIAPFDRWIEGDEHAISESAKRGFILFNTKANCSSCHSGWRLTDDGFHDVGTSTTDLGRGSQLKDVTLLQYAFKTPTLRSVALRAPFMHNSSVATLYDALKHYETGGIDRPSRSPMMKPLKLSEEERLDLVAFMHTLTGVPEGEDPPALPK
jgi:cytochrome c peroxidase